MKSAIEKLIGKEIKEIKLTDHELILKFSENDIIVLQDVQDDIQSCENRYFTTDDKLTDAVGTLFQNIEVKNVKYGRNIDKNLNSHDISFIELTTNKQSFTIEAHNKHNGYYEGFDIVISYESNFSQIH